MSEPVDLVIVGGGTAGWMAAAALTAQLPPSRCRVRLVESDEIGIVGVGEATLPHMKNFNDLVGLNEAELMRRTQSTFKLGIEFVDWGYKGSSYIHPFGVHGRPGPNAKLHHQWLRARQNGHDFDLEALSYAIVASRRNRFDFPVDDEASIESSYSYAYHFDASLYAAYLREFCEARGVERIEGRIVDVSLDAGSGNIASLQLESGEVVTGDFFIDCSGFRSLLVGQKLGCEWEDWTKWLPCDRAWAVPCEKAGAFTPYTRSTAREAGWQWRIPLQHRTGNGHVYSSSFTSDEAAADILLANLDGAALAEPRLLRFQAGRRSKSWTRNCVALGLASGFLEPLESTSIYLIQIGIMNLLPLFPEKRVDPALAAEFNRRMDVEYARIRDFLILHYWASSRDDSELWRYCRNMDVPDSLRDKRDQFVHRGYIEEYREGLFTPPSWLSVYVGQGVIPRHYHPTIDNRPIEKIVADLDSLRSEISDRVDLMPLHQDFVADYCASDIYADDLADFPL